MHYKHSLWCRVRGYKAACTPGLSLFVTESRSPGNLGGDCRENFPERGICEKLKVKNKALPSSTKLFQSCFLPLRAPGGLCQGDSLNEKLVRPSCSDLVGHALSCASDRGRGAGGTQREGGKRGCPQQPPGKCLPWSCWVSPVSHSCPCRENPRTKPPQPEAHG